jgi:hypothetical protein
MALPFELTDYDVTFRGGYWSFGLTIFWFSVLAIFNFAYYFVKKIRVLSDNKFHLLMFTLI